MKPFTQLCFFLFGSGFVLVSSAADNALQQPTETTTDRYSITFRMGDAINPISNSVLIPPPPATDLDPELFSTSGGDSHFLDYGVEFTYLIPLRQAWSLHTGVEYLFGSRQQVNGEYYARPLPPADQTYTFDLQIQRMLAVSELWYQINSSWSAFGGVNAGVARIYSSALQFSSIPQPGGESQALTSNETQTTNFAYGVSLGASYTINTQWQVKGGMDYSWLQDVSVPYNNGVSNVSVDIGKLSPYEFWLGVAYQF